MEFVQAQAALAPGRIFGGLSPVEQRTLFGWVAAARVGGIDTAEDLGFRLRPDDCQETVIGVFKSGHMLASWLVVGHGGSWAVASCGDGAVSQRVPSLADALKLVYPQRAAQAGARPATRQSRRDDKSLVPHRYSA